MLAAGSQAPEFRLPSVEGGEQSLAGLIDKRPVLLAFYKVSCPTCQFALPFLDRLSSGVPVVGIAQDDACSAAEFSRRFGLRFPSLIDDARGGYAVSNAYRIRNVPTLFLVEPDGQISMSVKGFSRQDLVSLGERFGIRVFRPEEKVPEFRPG